MAHRTGAWTHCRQHDHETPARAATIPWFWTQQFGRKLEYASYQEPFDRVTIEEDLNGFSFLATQRQGVRQVGVVAVGLARTDG
ncbi:oxidoreductase C-terminal domain-containing protein [Komagataeibacter medellinensis]|uniref:oxidoreductase C-terminal domain-containing protein n=1 Tax=Komagataeibacter medellinensis TaxID=1177712 RepID=UPI002B2013B7|nr:oxidoreductase C-terminal domain-containing protein [Komagataeibacter medellinensis]